MSTSHGRHEMTPEGGGNSDFAVVATAQFESGPPASKMPLSTEEGEVFETLKEEAWEERRKKTTTKTSNIERRVQRKLVLEDGEVVGDTGPVVTEDKTEDVITNEVVSDEKQRPEGQTEALEAPPGDGWVALPGALIISEKRTTTTKSHDEVEDELETEEQQHCGDVTNKEAEDHVQGRSDLRDLIAHRQNQGWELAQPQKKIVHEATRRRGNIDTTDVRETSKVQGGHVVTETERTVRQEEYDNESAPDSGTSLSDGSVHEAAKETSHNLVHTKDEDILEYYAVPRGGTLAQGVKLGEGMHVVSEDVQEDRQGDEGEALKKPRRPGRRDALTKKFLDYNQEEATRKCETNRWLEHHFGSESGRSESSSQEVDETSDRQRHTAGGNRITIMMSPRPATPEDTVDASPSHRQWSGAQHHGSYAHQDSSVPSKSGRVESAIHLHSSPPPEQTPSNDHQDSVLAAARARLRSTGRNLIEENKENNAPETVITSNVKSSNRFQTPSKPELTPSSSLKEDIVYSSRLRSGGKANYNSPHSTTISPPLLSTSPPSYVGRSQSFHVSTIPWSSSKRKDYSTSKFETSIKDYHSEERLDDIDRRGRNNYTVYTSKPTLHPVSSKERTSSSLWQHLTRKPKSTWSPPREPTPPPPPRKSQRGPIRNSAEIFAGREASTQTSKSPVPPPRTKRKKRPKSSYFFGQENGIGYNLNSSMVNGISPHSQGRDRLLSDNSYSTSLRYSTDIRQTSHQSPNEDRWYHASKPVPPVLSSLYKDKSGKYSENRDSYYSSDKAAWTNTVDPRRKPRNEAETVRSTTLPRRAYDSNLSHPKKTYIFGESNNSNTSGQRIQSSNYKGSMHDISFAHSDSHTDANLSSSPYRISSQTGKQVGRSHSFNVQPGQHSSHTLMNGQPLTKISGQKTSSSYRSSPYLNLQSPNLISTIARTSSIRRAEASEEQEPSKQENEEDKRSRFMKGLLSTAPELYHFIHGKENEKSQEKEDSHQLRNATSSLNKSTSSPSYVSPSAAKSPTYSARIFTFGKGDSNTLTRTTSQGQSVYENEVTDSYGSSLKDEHNTRNLQISEKNRRNEKESSPSDYDKRHYSLSNGNKKSTFNMKTSGSSLLYSPSFRSENEDRRRSRPSVGSSKDRLSGDFTGQANMGEGNAVLIQVRDWNMR